MNFFSRALSLFLISIQAYSASITVNPLTVIFDDSNVRYQDIKVYNTGEETAYVNADISRIHHPGTEEKTLEPMKANPTVFGMVANPNKLIIPVGQSRIVRVMRLVRNNTEDVVYQLNIVPATGTLQQVKDAENDVVAGIQVVVGYNIAVRVLPENPRPLLEWTRKGQVITLENKGNTSVLLSNGQQCGKEEGTDVCKDLPVRRLYAGNAWTMELPFDAPLSYLKSALEREEQININ